MTKARELREYTTDELGRRLEEARREIVALRLQAATGQLDKTNRIGYLRKEIARILTILRERELGLERPVGLPEETRLAREAGKSAGVDAGTKASRASEEEREPEEAEEEA